MAGKDSRKTGDPRKNRGYSDFNHIKISLNIL